MSDSFEIRQSGDRYDLVYTSFQDGGRVLWRYEIHPGYKLFRVNATFASCLPDNCYYVVAKTARTARQIFKARFSWLNIIRSVVEVQDPEASTVLSHPFLHIVV